jgi:hypothetical protein
MRTLGHGRYALTIAAAATSLAGCRGSQPPTGAPGAMPAKPRDQAARYQL